MKTRHCMTALAGFMILDYLCFFPLKRCLRLKGFVIPVDFKLLQIDKLKAFV